MRLRLYVTYPLLSLLFNVGIPTVYNTIQKTWVLLWHHFNRDIVCPSMEKWRGFNRRVGYVQWRYWVHWWHITRYIFPWRLEHRLTINSGHRKCYCIHSVIIIDNPKQIRYVYSGFRGHMNDAQIYREPDGPLRMHHNCWILADGIYIPIEHPFITPYRQNQINAAQPKITKRPPFQYVTPRGVLWPYEITKRPPFKKRPPGWCFVTTKSQPPPPPPISKRPPGTLSVSPNYLKYMQYIQD